MANYYGNDLDNITVGGFTNYYGGDGNDLLQGNAHPNQVYGGEGYDFIVGSNYTGLNGSGTVDSPYLATAFFDSGNDYLEGGAGDDVAYGADGDDIIYGGDGNDGGTILGYAGIYFVGGLFGGDGNDSIFAGYGDDDLYGGKGKDALFGGPDNDWFYFNTALDKKTNVDRIYGFSLSDDEKIVLSQAIFTDIGSTLKKKQFHIGTNATDKKQRIIYDDEKGKLFFDHDGKGGDPKVLFATIDKELELSAGDFIMIA